MTPRTHIPASSLTKLGSLLLVLGLTAATGWGQIVATWTTTTTPATWGTGTNWSGGTAPTTTSDTAIFSGTGTTAYSVQIGVATSLNSLQFNTSRAYTITKTSGGSGKSLTMGGTAPTITQSGAGNQIVSVSNGLILGADTSISVSSTGSLTISAPISGSFGITKTGAGTGALILSGSNTSYSGTTTISGGILQLGNANGLGTGNIVFGGGTLQYGSGITADVSPHIVNSTSSIAVDTGSNAVTFVSALASSNTGGLTKSGSGALTFSAANAYTGTTLISAGSIKLGAADRIADSSAVSVATGATFNLNSFSETVGSIAGAGTIAFGTTGTSVRTLTVGGDNTNTTYSGAFTGTSGTGAMTLTKNGTGVLTLSGNNTIAFNTTIANGTLALGHANGLGTGNIVFGGGILQYGTAITADVSTHIVNSTGAIAIDTNNNSVTYASALVSSNTGGLTKSGLGTLTLSGNNAYTGTTAINNGTLALGHANGLSSGNIVFGGGTLQYATGITADVSPHIVNSASSIAVDTNSNSVTYASAIASSNTGGLTKSGLGELTLTAANTYSGGTTVNGGTLTVSGSGTLGSTSGALTVNTGGILGIGTTNQTVGAVTLAGGTINGTGTLTSNTSFTSTGGTINANLAGTAGFTHTSGTTTLNGTIGYSGDTTVNGGTLIFNSALTSTTASIGSGATLQLAALATGSSIGTLNLNGGTLLLGAGSYSFTTINVTGASTIDFGSGTGATLSNTNFTLDAGASLTVLNWANGVDNFYVDSLSGATLDGTRSTGSLSQISFSGYASNSTGWINEGGYKKITPVPEPGTYGALFGGGALLLWFWRRRENRKIGKSGNRKTWETWV